VSVYGITMDYKVIICQMGSPEMMECREIQFELAEANHRAVELKRVNEERQSHER